MSVNGFLILHPMSLWFQNYLWWSRNHKRTIHKHWR